MATTRILEWCGRLYIWLLLAFAVSWFYFGLFETFWNGQTPGKRMMGLRVLSVTGQPINAMQAILRNILRAVDAMPRVPRVISVRFRGQFANAQERWYATEVSTVF